MNIGKRLKSGFRRWLDGGDGNARGGAVHSVMQGQSPSVSSSVTEADLRNAVPNKLDKNVYEGLLTIRSSLAVVEICAGYWSRAFEGAKVFVDGMPIEKYMMYGDELSVKGVPDVDISPQMLGLMGREIMTFGESVFKIYRMMYGAPKVSFVPACTYDVWGNAMPSTWRYNLEVSTPDGRDDETNQPRRQRERYDGVASNDVLHTMYACQSSTPWIGVGPLLLTRKTYQALEKLESMLLAEVSSPSGTIIPVEKQHPVSIAGGTIVEYSDYVKQKLEENSGGLSVLERPTVDIHSGTDKSLPTNLLQQIRYGFEAREDTTEYREHLTRNIAEALGLPASIVAADTGSRAVRDGMRQFSDMTIQPKFKSVASEMSRKLKAEVTMYVDKSFDSGTTARALGTLTRSMGNDMNGNPLPGVMSPQDAARICGLPPELFGKEFVMR